MAEISVPSFRAIDLDLDRTDGYFVHTFHFSKDDAVPGVVVFGMDSADVAILDNPLATNPKASVCDAWTKQVVATLPKPTAIVSMDITGNGWTDLVVSYQLGASMLGCDPDGGHIVWLENPGRDGLGKQDPWKAHYIGRWPAMHRLTMGRFTQKDHDEVIAASVVCGPHNKAQAVPILLFSPPDDVENADKRECSIVDDKNFPVIHELIPKSGDGPDGRDSFYVASREGLSRLYYDDDDKKWQHEKIGAGLPKDPSQDPNSETPGMGDFWGTGGADTGRIADDPCAYIASVEPFHGFRVSVYVKDGGAHAGPQQQQAWTRHVLDSYGTPTQQTKTGAGPVHYVVCGDFDGDGDDEFLVSMFGPIDRDSCGNSAPGVGGYHPFKGIMYYKAVDLANGVFAKWRISERTSGRIALGNFTNSKQIDIASIDFSMKSYRVEPNPRVQLLVNETQQLAQARDIARSIRGTVWDEEGLVYIPEPTAIHAPSTLPLIKVGDYAISVEVHPPNATVEAIPGDGVKALYGSLADQKQKTWRPIGGPAFPAKQSIAVGSTEDEEPDQGPEAEAGDWTVLLEKVELTTDATQGAVFLRLHRETHDGPWPCVDKVPVEVTFKTVSPHLTLPDLAFRPVQELWWGGDAYAGVNYHNLRGFNFQFADDKGPIAHLQFWAAGTKTNSHFHNHSNDILRELGICLSNGTEEGGVWVPCAPDSKRSAAELNMLQANHPEKFTRLALKELEEHGRVWEVDEDGQASRGWQNVVVYPWHTWRGGKGENMDVWMTVEFDADLDLGKSSTGGVRVAMR